MVNPLNQTLGGRGERGERRETAKTHRDKTHRDKTHKDKREREREQTDKRKDTGQHLARSGSKNRGNRTAEWLPENEWIEETVEKEHRREESGMREQRVPQDLLVVFDGHEQIGDGWSRVKLN